MTAILGPVVPNRMALPTLKELKTLMATTPSVIITMIVCGTILCLAAIGGVVFLAYNGNDTAVIGTLFVVVLTAVGGLLNVRMRQTRDAVQKSQE